MEVRHDDWVFMVDDHGNLYYWNRRHNTTHWSVPHGMLHWWVRLKRGTFLDVETHVEVQFLPGLDGG